MRKFEACILVILILVSVAFSLETQPKVDADNGTDVTAPAAEVVQTVTESSALYSTITIPEVSVPPSATVGNGTTREGFNETNATRIQTRQPADEQNETTDVTTVAAEVVQNVTGDSSELNTTIMIATTESPMRPSTTEEVFNETNAPRIRARQPVQNGTDVTAPAAEVVQTVADISTLNTSIIVPITEAPLLPYPTEEGLNETNGPRIRARQPTDGHNETMDVNVSVTTPFAEVVQIVTESSALYSTITIPEVSVPPSATVGNGTTREGFNETNATRIQTRQPADEPNETTDVTTVAAEVVQTVTDSLALNTTIMIATTELPMLPSTTEQVFNETNAPRVRARQPTDGQDGIDVTTPATEVVQTDVTALATEVVETVTDISTLNTSIIVPITEAPLLPSTTEEGFNATNAHRIQARQPADGQNGTGVNVSLTTPAAEVQTVTDDSLELNTTIMISTTEASLLQSTTGEVFNETNAPRVRARQPTDGQNGTDVTTLATEVVQTDVTALATEVVQTVTESSALNTTIMIALKYQVPTTEVPMLPSTTEQVKTNATAKEDVKVAVDTKKKNCTEKADVLPVTEQNVTATTTLAPCRNRSQSIQCTEFRVAENRAWNVHSALFDRLEQRRKQLAEWNTEQRHLIAEQTRAISEARGHFLKLPVGVRANVLQGINSKLIKTAQERATRRVEERRRAQEERNNNKRISTSKKPENVPKQ